MNKVCLIGNLARDPETRTLASGVVCTTFTLAVNRRFTNQQGVREADFIPIVTWRQTAEVCARYLAKGRKCAVVGSIQTRTYDAQDGSKRYVTEVIADEVDFIGSSGQGGGQAGNDVPPPPEPTGFSPKFGAAQGGASAPASANAGFGEADDDELPF